MMNSGRGVIVVVLLEISLALLAYYWYGATLTALQTATRLSGILSLVIFSIIFLFRHKPGNFDVLLLRQPYGTFAVAQGMHLVWLLGYIQLTAQDLDALRIAGGVVFYVFVFLMPWLVARRETRTLPVPTFAVIEKIFLYYAWLIFFMTYLPRVRGFVSHVGGSYREHVILLGWVSLMLGMKITGLLTFRTNTSR